MKNIFRRIRGAIGNALTWGVAWFAGGLALAGGLIVTGFYPASAGWVIALAIAKNLGVTGFFTGGVFSVYLGLAHHHHQLHDLRAGRMALVGAAIAAGSSLGLLVATFGAVLTANALIVDGLIAAVFGAITAGGTIGLSQRASRGLRGARLEGLEREQTDVDRFIGGSG
jgi:hypothetical protein